MSLSPLGKRNVSVNKFISPAIFACLCMPLHVLRVFLSCLHDYMSELLGMLLFSLYSKAYRR